MRSKVEDLESSIGAMKKTVATLEEELARVTAEKNVRSGTICREDGYV